MHIRNNDEPLPLTWNDQVEVDRWRAHLAFNESIANEYDDVMECSFIDTITYSRSDWCSLI